MNRRLAWLVLVVLAGGALSCAGSKEVGAYTGAGGTGGGSSVIPLRPCSNNAQCAAGSACVANQCVVKRTSIDDLAIEINPQSGSQSQITELPSVGTAMPLLQADAAFSLTISFTIMSGGNAQSTPATAAVIVTVPSRIAGRPDLSFQANLSEKAATLSVPQALRGAQATVTLLPTGPAEQTSPPYRMTTVIPLMQDTLALELPANRLQITGQVRDASDKPPMKTYTARAFQQGLLASSNGSTDTNANGAFAISLPGNTTGSVSLELVPALSTDPWVTFNDPLAPANTDLGIITLPGYLTANLFRVPAYGNDASRTPVVDARVRAYTTLNSDDADRRISTKYLRDGTTDATGGANLLLIPGDSSISRAYTVSVVPTPGSAWASRCLTNVAVAWTGMTQTAFPLSEVSLSFRSVISGLVTSANGVPVDGMLVRATLLEGVTTPPCLPSPTTTSVTTDENGLYRLPVDPGRYQLDFIPAAGSAIPRFTIEEERVSADVTRNVMMPAPALVEGDLQDAMNAKLPNATIRFFEPRCESGGCKSPLLRAEVQTDAEGHFRAIVAAPPGTY
jgi:hypothetical protein